MALGKKLNTLLESYFGDEAEYDTTRDRLVEIELYKIQTSPHQPRTHFDDEGITALGVNIDSHGLLQPITVVEISPDVYQLISGERRLRAFKHLNREKIPAILKDIKTLDDRQQATLSLFENLHRENLSPMDTAQAFWQLRQLHSWTNQELAGFLNCSKQHVDNYFRLFDLALPVQEALGTRRITEGHARLLHNLKEAEQISVLEKVIESQLSVKATQRLISSLHTVTHVKIVDSELKQSVQNFQSRFPGCKISFNGNKKSGSMLIKWNAADQFPMLN